MQLLPPPQRVPLVVFSYNLPLVTPCIVALEKIACHYVAALLSVGSTRELDAVHTWVNNYSSWPAPYTSNRYVTALLFISLDKLARVPIQTSPLSRVLRRYKVSFSIFYACNALLYPTSSKPIRCATSFHFAECPFLISQIVIWWCRPNSRALAPQCWSTFATRR